MSDELMELLPCPFCGHAAHVFTDVDGYNTPTGYYDVGCRNLECILCDGISHGSSWWELKELAQLWNRRVKR